VERPFYVETPVIRLYRVILPVSDNERATQLYQELLAAPRKRVSSGRHYFNCGGTILACVDPRADGGNFDAQPNPQHIYFAVPNLEEVFARAQQAECSHLEEKIDVRPWQERSFYAKDPFGNRTCFVDDKTLFTGE
jgi:uncharacterized glyoxalase superfamily protein PhnB